MSCFLILLVMGLLVTLVLGEDCPYKLEDCYCAGQDIFCDDRGLKQMPQLLIKERPFASFLDLDANDITTIPAGSLPANLSGISIQYNPLETIDDASFEESIYSLHGLTLSQARFTQIPEAVFHLKALNSLSLYEINILVWDDDSMKLLAPTIETLSLDTVGLTTWPTWIKSMANLTELTISGSSISFIPDDALDMVTDSLVLLHLSNNSLTTLSKTLTKMTALSSLSLDHNRITDVAWLPQLSRLVGLSLNNNRITDAQQLSSALKLYADTLVSFDINNNSLTSIPELWFMSKITTLDFTCNHISDSNSGSAPSNLTELKIDNNFLPFIPVIMNSLNLLDTLNLNSNNIRIIEGTEFLPRIQVVNLDYNLISQLSSSSFPNDSRIYYLALSNNPISIISPDAFINIPFLTELYLQETKLTRLPLAIAHMTNLDFLEVSGNTNLVCTCQEQSLQRAIQAIMSYYVRGDCGQTSVDYFFKHLSPLCPPLM